MDDAADLTDEQKARLVRIVMSAGLMSTEHWFTITRGDTGKLLGQMISYYDNGDNSMEVECSFIRNREVYAKMGPGPEPLDTWLDAFEKLPRFDK